ncbi:MAG: hypothetical protein KDD40_08925, partial [Bdellovibrionales bacterium]|nr:hypothetical protein [Bdellovibrionales bacterium]
MKKNAIANRDSQILIFIHIILTSFVLYFVLTGGGCEKKEELGEASPGPEVELTDIAKAYFKSTENSAEDLLTTNYSSLYEINQRVELGQTLKFVDTKRTIKCILRNGTQTQIALAIDTIFYDQYGNIVERKPSRDYILDTYSLDTTGRPV